MEIYICLIVWNTLSYRLLASTLQEKESCDDDTFSIECGRGEVILMTSALYGRMELGRCVKLDLFTGCYTDVLTHLDKMCSGKQTCTAANIANTLSVANPCSEMSRYLKATYKCVFNIMSECQLQTELASSGFLFNSDLGCGNMYQPLQVKVQEWQRINVTLIDFSVRNSTIGRDISTCLEYAFVKDKFNGWSLSVCSDIQRKRHLFISESNLITIGVKPPIATGGAKFALYLEVVGCPAPNVGPDMKLSWPGDHVTITCPRATQSWHLRCHDNRWIGSVGNCTTVPGEVPSQTDEARLEFPLLSNTLVMALIGSIATVVTAAIVICGLICFKRYQPNIPDPELDLQPNDILVDEGIIYSVPAYEEKPGYQATKKQDF